jgi:hypothetical protein
MSHYIVRIAFELHENELKSQSGFPEGRVSWKKNLLLPGHRMIQ